MSLENFNEKKVAIEAIPDNETANPNIPVPVAVQEGEDLYVWAKEDKEELKKAGLDMTLLDELPVRAGALRYIQSIWQKEYNTFEDAQEEWKQRSPEAFDLHDILIHEFLFAYHNYPDLLSKVRTIAEGSSNADMLQDLSDLSVLGKSNPEPLTAISLNMSLLDQAETMVNELSEVLAKANGLRMSDNATKIIRDKAFAYLKQAVDEVRRCGQYKFWRNENRRKGYISKYNKRRARSSDQSDQSAA